MTLRQEWGLNMSNKNNSQTLHFLQCEVWRRPGSTNIPPPPVSCCGGASSGLPRAAGGPQPESRLAAVPQEGRQAMG